MAFVCGFQGTQTFFFCPATQVLQDSRPSGTLVGLAAEGGRRDDGGGVLGGGENSKRRIQRIILSTIFSPTATQQTENKIQNNKQTKYIITTNNKNI